MPSIHGSNKYLLIFQDELPKYKEIMLSKEQDTSTISQAFVKHIVLQFNIPQTIFGVRKNNTMAYHLQSNGALERSRCTLVEYLRDFISEDQSNWDDWMLYATFMYNTTPHTVTVE
ncbi:hypothetical protein J437_LFUL015716 [Ladona fulva]|uniref:Integrase catalytic domain-containing protein n=1 Tax=Ladona fulva TaxID=123851 RepID=A0A8K0P9F0_LADFU|nr:hypothetical protein J437_LFUL015716 [Ladona fulva]